MEQELLDRLDAATTSIDAAICELDRQSVWDAPIAAAGIIVVGDARSAIWNNSGDCACLRDSSSALMDSNCY